MTAADIRVSIDFEDEEDAGLLEESAREESVEATRQRGLEPITTIVLVGGISAVAGAIAGWLRRRRRKGKEAWGQVIDLRPDAKDPVYRDEDLEFGQIVVITPSADGKTYEVKIEVYDPDNDFTEIAKLIAEKLSEGVVKPLDTLAQAAKEAVGSKGEVKVEERAAA
jgi:hypothetical protein